MLRLRRKNPVGLDIDASTVRMVQVRKDGARYVVVKAGVVEIAPWGHDPHLQRIHTVRAIVDGLARYGINGKLAVCGLRGPEVVLRSFDFPALPPEEISGAVELEASQICPFLAEESTLDYQVTTNGAQRTRGFWVAATHSLVEDIRRVVARAGLHCALVDVTGLALLNLLEYTLKCKELERQASDSQGPDADSEDSSTQAGAPLQRSCPAVLNLGDSCATIAIADPAGRPFVRDIGGAPLDTPRSSATVPGGGPGALSAEDGWAMRNEGRSATSDSLVEEVATTLRYYAAQNGTVRVDRLLVCGGPAAVEHLESLHARLNLDVELWDPFVDRGARDQDGGGNETPGDDPSAVLRPPRFHGPSLVVATGLAMRSI